MARDRLVGALVLAARDPAAITAERVTIAREVADQLAVAISHARQRGELERAVARLALVHEIDAAILRNASPRAVAGVVAERLLALTAAEQVSVARTSAAGLVMRDLVGRGADEVARRLDELPRR